MKLSQASIWPNSIPALEWRGWILAGDASTTVDVSNSPLGEALRLIYPQLGIASIAQILSQISEHADQAENVCHVYGLRWSDRLEQVFRLILTTPVEFQVFVDEKKFSARDLFPLLAVKKLEAIEPLLKHLAKSGLSRSLAVQALEWSIELFLMDVPMKTILANDNNWWPSLQKLRRPRESEQSERRDRFLKEAPLPSYTSGQWLKESDQPALEIKMQARSPQELQQQLEKLKSISEAWQKMEST